MRMRMTIAALLLFAIVLSGCSVTKALPAAGVGGDSEGVGNAISEGLAEDTQESDHEVNSGTQDAGTEGVQDGGTVQEGGAAQEGSGVQEGGSAAQKDGAVQKGDSEVAAGTSYKLKEPEFITVEPTSFCKLAEDYINLSNEEFSKLYTEDELWKLGAFDRLLFTKYAKGNIVKNIGIGSSLQQVLDTFGNCQFGTEEKFDKSSTEYHRYLLYGYKTRDFYFAFRIDPETKLVNSICLRKRYAMPDEMKDMLVVLSKYGDWYGAEFAGDITDQDQWNKYFENDRVKQTQWGRGTMTMICDYGFTSSSGMGIEYGVYADYTGDIPVLPARQSEWDEGTYEPVTVFELDYPEWMIYRIYYYLAEQEDAIKYKNGLLSSDEDMFAYAVDGDWLDMRSSGLYEWAHVVFHSMNGKYADKHMYFGHYSSLVGFIGERYFAETNMMGLHVVDLKDWSTVYREETVDGGYNLRLDEKNQQILDEEGKVWYKYDFNADGEITVSRIYSDG